jgi:hypothetical protein
VLCSVNTISGGRPGLGLGGSLSLGPDEQQLRDPAAVPVAVWAVARPARVTIDLVASRRVVLPCRLQRDRYGGFAPLPRTRRDVRSRPNSTLRSALPAAVPRE